MFSLSHFFSISITSVAFLIQCGSEVLLIFPHFPTIEGTAGIIVELSKTSFIRMKLNFTATDCSFENSENQRFENNKRAPISQLKCFGF